MLAFILLHSVVPHTHHSDMTATEHLVTHNSATGLLDILGTIFHNDLGDDDDEYLVLKTKVLQGFVFSIFYSEVFKLLNYNLYQNENTFFTDVVPISYQNFVFAIYSLRAPPILNIS